MKNNLRWVMQWKKGWHIRVPAAKRKKLVNRAVDRYLGF